MLTVHGYSRLPELIENFILYGYWLTPTKWLDERISKLQEIFLLVLRCANRTKFDHVQSLSTATILSEWLDCIELKTSRNISLCFLDSKIGKILTMPSARHSLPLNISLISYLNIWVFLYDSIVAKIFFKNQSINWKGEREEGGDSGDVEGTNYLFAVGLP